MSLITILRSFTNSARKAQFLFFVQSRKVETKALKFNDRFQTDSAETGLSNFLSNWLRNYRQFSSENFMKCKLVGISQNKSCCEWPRAGLLILMDLNHYVLHRRCRVSRY